MTNARRIAALLLAFAVLPAVAADFRIPVGPAHALRLEVPEAWHGTNLESDSSTTAVFVPAQGGLKLMLTAMATPDIGALPHSLADMRATVADAAERAAPTAAEAQLPVHDLRGDVVQGAWFSATDKATTLPPGEYRYLTQGELTVGGITAVFTLLVNADDAATADRIRDEALAALRTLRTSSRSDGSR